ncbi:MAG: hypothetical protein GXO65_05410 [Euryarchaeota archaeon]|nr:hypothetical protein [Euryarchaeota archaeon]
MEVRIRVKVYPTESPEKVRQAVENVFEVRLEEEGGYLVGTCTGLDRLHRLLRRQRLLDAARGVLLAGLEGNRTRFCLNKQAAFVGRVNFSSTAPLGPIEVEVEDEDIRGVIDRLAPETREGKEIV